MKAPHDGVASISELTKLAKLGFDKRAWYSRATNEILAVCRAENWNPLEFARKLAILSPQISVVRNCRATIAYFGQGKIFDNILPTVLRSMEIYETTGKIGGDKVSAFANALLGDQQAIVLDTWMGKALFPLHFGKDNPARFFRRKSTRLECEHRVWSVARRLQIAPRNCQAAIWSGTFRSYDRQPAFMPLWDTYQHWLAYDREFPLVGVIDLEDYKTAEASSFSEPF